MMNKKTDKPMTPEEQQQELKHGHREYNRQGQGTHDYNRYKSKDKKNSDK